MKNIYIGVALLFFVLSFSSFAISQQSKIPASADTPPQNTDSGQSEKADKTENQGNGGAECAQGDKYYYGQGVPQDYTEAAKWYRKSAEQGNAASQGMLGLSYHFGEGVSQDYKKAAEWYRKAAKQKDALSLGMLGVLYEKGQGVSQDYKKAVEWYRRAVEQGNTSVQVLLDRVLEKLN